MELRPGTLIAGTYEILGPLGRGGMGELFRGRNVRTERKVALKLLRPDAKHKAEAMERFRREARAAGMINSDHVTQVLDIQDDPEHGIAIVFELLEGENLLDHLRRTGVMSLEVIFPIILQVLRGLQDAHSANIIHRDLKPSNIFLEKRPDGSSRIKILDFGISKLPKSMAKDTLTEPGQALGSYMFMPPEQIQRAANVDQRADIYAIGTLVFQAMTGHLPYNSQNLVELMRTKVNADPRTLQEVSGKPFPPALQQWVDRCLRRNLNERFQTAAEAIVAWQHLGASFGLAQASAPSGSFSPYVPPPSSNPRPTPQAYPGNTPVAVSVPPTTVPAAAPIAKKRFPVLLVVTLFLVLIAAIVLGAVIYTVVQG